MNRVTAVAATLATAAAATMAAATIGPAMAAPRSVAGHPAAHARSATAHARTAPAKATGKQAKPASSLPTEIASEIDGGKYVTVVRCQGVDSPPPVHLGKPGTPLIVSGGGPSSAISKMLKQADPYKDIYTCTVLVEEKVPAKPRAAVTKKIAAHKVRGCEIATGGGTRCTKKVTLNTGFGGLAPQVKQHHPAG
ncbi:MAG TPA: hypothetical protein VGG54_33420 [Trebonia sp.]|jgi:hypothetical protein